MRTNKKMQILIIFLVFSMLIPTIGYANDTSINNLYLAGSDNVNLTEEDITNAVVTDEMLDAARKNGSKTEQDEYDILIEAKEKITAQLNKEHNNEKSIEERILEISNKPITELQELGYSKEKIKILKEYDGSPIEDNQQLRAITGKIVSNFFLVKRNADLYTVGLDWEWTIDPLFNITDSIGMGFYYDSTAVPVMPLSTPSTPNNCNVVNPYTGQRVYLSSYLSEKDHKIYKINTYRLPQESSILPKRGTILNTITTSGRNGFKNGWAAFRYSYAHGIYGVSLEGIGLSCKSGSVGFSIKVKYDEVIHRHLQVFQTGNAKRLDDDR